MPETQTEMSGNVRPFRLSARRAKAAQLVAEGALTEAQIAAQLGIHDRQLRRWKKHPVFAELVADIAEKLAAEIRGKGLVELRNRVNALNQRWNRLHRIIDDRAKDKTMRAPGASTGLLTRTYKQIGSGESAEKVEEYQVDTGLLKELREHEKQAAQELGQWSDKAKVEQGPIDVKVVWSDEMLTPESGRRRKFAGRVDVEAHLKAPPLDDAARLGGITALGSPCRAFATLSPPF
jgi:transposase-like protein